ncbi:rhomboid protease GluP [bacterium A37T11]|nr:rhomboid protease GluP [bacterium A37T11]
MAIGLNPHYSLAMPLDGIPPTHFLVMAMEVAKQLGWDIAFADADTIIAFTGSREARDGEQVSLTVWDTGASLLSQCKGYQLIDGGKNRQNIEQFMEAFHHEKQRLATDDLDERYKALMQELEQDDEMLDEEPHKPTGTTELFSFLIVGGDYFITPLLIWLNSLIYALMIICEKHGFTLTADTLVAWGANFRIETQDGQWWRMLTCIFLHASFFHLVFNMYALYYIGAVLEPILGRWRFLTAYLLAGIAGSMVSIYWNEFIVCIGASGAIFGMYGLYLALLSTNLVDARLRWSFMGSILIFVGYSLLGGFTNDGVDNAAHVGGLLTGIVLGFALYPTLKGNPTGNLSVGIFAATAVFMAGLFGYFFQQLPDDIDQYKKRMETFSTLEALAMEVYSYKRTYASKEEVMAEIKNRGIYYWNEAIQLVKDVDTLQLPPALHARNQVLLKYSNLRISNYQYIYDALAQGATPNKDTILHYSQRLEAIMQEAKEAN